MLECWLPPREQNYVRSQLLGVNFDMFSGSIISFQWVLE